MELKVGQVVEFFRPVEVDGKVIPKGTRAKVAYLLPELLEPKVVLILLSGDKPEAVIVDRHDVTVNSLAVRDSA